jgi:hypothetical protein
MKESQLEHYVAMAPFSRRSSVLYLDLVRELVVRRLLLSLGYNDHAGRGARRGGRGGWALMKGRLLDFVVGIREGDFSGGGKGMKGMGHDGFRGGLFRSSLVVIMLGCLIPALCALSLVG